jgi:broad specificity phosphatase PhoE
MTLGAPPTELWLVRHGQTDWNLSGRYQGQADLPVNATGLEQARQIARRLPLGRFAALYSSDLLRARQTAEIIAERLELPVRLDPRLREIHQGEWEGLRYVDVVERYADLAAAYQADPAAWRAPRGESVSEVAIRMVAAANDLYAEHPGQSVLVVAHGLCIATLACRVRGIPLSQVYDHIPPNAEPLQLTYPPISGQFTATAE